MLLVWGIILIAAAVLGGAAIVITTVISKKKRQSAPQVRKRPKSAPQRSDMEDIVSDSSLAPKHTSRKKITQKSETSPSETVRSKPAKSQPAKSGAVSDKEYNKIISKKTDTSEIDSEALKEKARSESDYGDDY